MTNDSNNMDLKYSYHYENWHTEETQEADIKYYTKYLESHNITNTSKQKKILEIGCASGNLLLALRRLGFKNLKGVEIDEKQVEICQKRGLDVSKSHALDFLNNNRESFNIIFMLDVLEHLPKSDQLKTLRLIFKTLSDDGILMLSVPNALAPLSHYFENIDWTHYCSFSPTSLSFLLKNSGFFDFTLRPTHQESYQLRQKKKPWIDLFEIEFGIKNPIMTPSIVAICFKSKKNLNTYISIAPNLMKFNKPKSSFLNSVKKILKNAIRKFN